MRRNFRRKVKSTPFSNFFRNATVQQKTELFDRVIKNSISKQQELISRAAKIRVTNEDK